MITKWTSHLKDDEDKKKFESSIIRSKHVLNRLKDMLKELETDLDISEINPKFYELPNWDYRQAHNNGFRQCVNLIKRIIDLDQETK